MAHEAILIVDDNAANLKLLRITLTVAGYEVRTAADAEQAIAVLASFHPRLILMDIQLPGMDGLELTRRLKADPATRAAVVVAVTSYAMKGDEERALAAGCDGYITKPVDTRSLPAMVASYLGGGPLREGARERANEGASDEASEETHARSPPCAPLAAPKPRVVLVIEDNELTRELVRLTLASEGYVVILAPTGAEALASLAATPPDLILQDLLLPDMDGFDLVARLRAHPAAAGVPIVAFSGFLSRLEYGRASGAGFTDFLPKPVEPSRLLQCVRVHLPLEAGAAPAGAPTKRGSGRRILIVDDNPMQLKLATLRFSALGFDVSSARDGADALAVLRRGDVQAVLSDVLMPVVDGFMLCAEMRKDAAFARIPIVLLSSNYVEEADREVGRSMGATDFVECTPDLVAAIKAVELALETPPDARLASVRPDAAGYHHRVLRQLELQAAMNTTSAYHLSTHASMLSVVAGISEALTHRGSVEAVLPDILASLLDASGVSQGALFLMATRRAEPDAGRRFELRVAQGFSDPIAKQLDSFCGHPEILDRAAETKETLVLGGSEADGPRRPPDPGAEDLLRKAGVETALAIPFVADSECFGVLFLASRARDLTERDWLPFSRAISVQLGQTLALNRAFARLTASETRYRALVDGAQDAIFTLDLDGRILQVNPAFENIADRSSKDVIGARILDFIAPDDLDDARAQFALLLENKIPRSNRRRLLRPDGGVVVFDISASTREVDGRRVVLAIARDVTERERSARDLRLLQTVTLAASEAPDLPSALDVVLRTVCEEAGWAFGAAWIPQDPASPSSTLRCERYWVLVDADRPRYGPLTASRFAREEGVLGRTWASGKATWTPNLATEADCPRGAAASSLGVHAGLAVPVLAAGEVIAVLEFFSDRTRAEDPRLVVVMSTLASQLADVLERKRAERALRASEGQLRQAQKMEAVGRLAGGIAHDFNNLLSVILSYAEIILSDLGPRDPNRDMVEEIGSAGKRAAGLTRQLLMFSRQQVLETKVLDLNELIANLEKILGRLIGADVDLVCLRAPDLGTVRADPGSLEQVLMNLVVNARDAMPTGGKLTIETANVFVDEAFARVHLGTKPGPCVMLAVSDTGCGMDAATQVRIFEPFFTTKDKDKGTGLGLSTVFGIVQQSGGSIWVYSEVGKGTAFRVYLPRVDAPADDLSKAERTPFAKEGALRGSETILLVEDEDAVRAVARDILASHGYEVLVARDAGEATRISRQTTGVIDLLLSDVVMPNMSGPELAQRLAVERPGMKVMCMSGYTDDSIVRHGILEAGIAYFQKPITPEALARRVREVLDASPRQVSEGPRGANPAQDWTRAASRGGA